MSGEVHGTNRLKDPDGFVLELCSRIDAIEECRIALLAYLEPFGLDEKAVNRVEVVLEELVSNIVRHNMGASRLVIAAKYRNQAVELAVEDDGAAYNPLERAEPDAFTTLDKAELGGLGLPLIRRLTKRVRYDRKGLANRITAIIATS